MKKWINLILQTAIYFLINILVFFIARKIGINSKASIWPFVIGSTIGWMIVQGVTIKKKHINKN